MNCLRDSVNIFLCGIEAINLEQKRLYIYHWLNGMLILQKLKRL